MGSYPKHGSRPCFPHGPPDPLRKHGQMPSFISVAESTLECRTGWESSTTVTSRAIQRECAVLDVTAQRVGKDHYWLIECLGWPGLQAIAQFRGHWRKWQVPKFRRMGKGGWESWMLPDSCRIRARLRRVNGGRSFLSQSHNILWTSDCALTLWIQLHDAVGSFVSPSCSHQWHFASEKNSWKSTHKFG